MDQTFANRSAKMEDDKCPPLQMADPKDLYDMSDNSYKRKRSSPTVSGTAAGPSTLPIGRHGADDKGNIPAGPDSSTYRIAEDKGKGPASSISSPLRSIQAPQGSSMDSEEAQWKLRAERSEYRGKLLEKEAASLQQQHEANEKENQDLRRRLMNALKRASGMACNGRCNIQPMPSEAEGLSDAEAADCKTMTDEELWAFLKSLKRRYY